MRLNCRFQVLPLFEKGFPDSCPVTLLVLGIGLVKSS